MEIKSKVALITGGSRGIGRATALLLAEKGADVAIIYNSRKEKAEEVKKIALSKGVKAEIYECDVSDYGKVKETVEQIVKDFGKINIVVNNAGILIKKPFLETAEEDWDKTINVDLKGVFNVCRFSIPFLLKNTPAKIVNVSSIAGRNGGTVGIPYAASKAGVIGITCALASEFTPKGIYVNAVAPGPVDTDLFKGLSPEQRKKLESLSPNGRFAKPEEIAHAIVFLIENDYISGETLNINAGRYMN
ncbi:MAG: 3-oxoacyl-ACP reductase FabG [Caldisericaceae bacterium]|nr:3-oxoacyl-ACP reductase FabG [Caldisericaceae bacterium]